jgi:competence protein ComEA
VATTAGDTVTVDVAGKVRRPGIAVLDAGTRVVDALRAAGGARAGVDLTGLNLARVLVDGEQIVVGLPAAATAPPTAPVAGSTPVGPLVDLNTATTVELEGLPEVGPVTAQAIVAWRDQHGGFTAVAELLEVDGIGDATLATIAPFVTV